MAKTKWGMIYNDNALGIDDMLHFGPLSEQAGAESIWTTEGWRDAFVPLTAMAGAVTTIRMGTGVAQMARPPVLTALTAQSLAEYTKGRFVLGVGTAPQLWNKNWHDLDVPRPVPRIREYMECIREVLKATPEQPANYRGEFYTITDYAVPVSPQL